MTGIRSKVVIAGIAALVMLCACSSGHSGPSQAQLMAAWEKGPGGKNLARVHEYLSQTVPLLESGQLTTLAGDGILLGGLALQAQDYPPPVDPSQYKQIMKDLEQAGFDLTKLANPNASNAVVESALTAASNEMQAASNAEKGVTASWVKQL